MLFPRHPTSQPHEHRGHQASQMQRVSPMRPCWWKPNCSHWAPKRGEWTRVALHHFSAMGWLVPFAPLLLFKQLRPQKPYRLLQSGEAPSHRVGANGNPGEKSKHRFTQIWWLTDITVSHQRNRSTATAQCDHEQRQGSILLPCIFLQIGIVVGQCNQDDKQVLTTCMALDNTSNKPYCCIQAASSTKQSHQACRVG